MRIPKQISVLAIAVWTLAGCRDKPATPPSLAEVMPNLPLPPAAEVIGRSGGPDALQITFRSQMNPQGLANYYRTTLSRNEWNLVSDTRGRDGVVTLYAERSGPPLWVTIRADSASEGSILTLSGAVIGKDSTPASTIPDTTLRVDVQ